MEGQFVKGLESQTKGLRMGRGENVIRFVEKTTHSGELWEGVEERDSRLGGGKNVPMIPYLSSMCSL